jgi:hypothetical protein
MFAKILAIVLSILVAAKINEQIAESMAHKVVAELNKPNE